jgi:ABC-type nitrate/sulfonate/bicarbonate transport system substrate-binding protein
MSREKIIQFHYFICFVLLLAACGATSQAASEPASVTLQLDWVNQADYAGYYIAQQDKYYEQENLTVTINPTDFKVTPIDHVLSGEAQFGVTGAIDLLAARAEGKPVVAVAAVYRRDPNLFLSLVEQNIKTPQDFIGKRVGVFPTQEFSYRLLLSLAKIDPSQVNYVPITEFTVRPLVEGEVDVLSGYATNEPLVAQEQGYKVNLISNNDYGVSIPAQVIFTTQTMIKDKPDVVQHFVQASLQGYKDVVENPKKGLLATLKVDETLDATHQENIIHAMIPLVAPDDKPIGDLDSVAWQQIVDILVKQGVLSAPIDPQIAYTAQFLK